MREKRARAIQVIALIVAGIFLRSVAAAQNAPTPLKEQLRAQYKLVKMGSDSNGPSVLEPGTVLTVQKGGILGIGPENIGVCPSTYQGSNLRPPGALCKAVAGNNTRNFQVGEMVYPSKIDVNFKKERISFNITACDSCNGVNPPTFFKSQVIFQFAKGYLETAGLPQVEDTIGQVLAIANSSEAQQTQGPQGGQPAVQPAAEGGQAGDQQPPAQPKTIQLGMTPEEVQAVLGQPEKIVNLGSKQILVYKDLKVTFVDGKVSDVQ